MDRTAAPGALAERTPSDDREAGRCGREVTLVGHRHDLIAQAKGEDGLRRARKQRANLHFETLSDPRLGAASRPVNAFGRGFRRLARTVPRFE